MNHSIETFCGDHDLKKKDVFLVAVSGGADSVAVLCALLDSGFTDLVVCHLNHGLRAEQSDQDQQFVIRLAQEHGLSVYTDRIDLSERKQSMELAARNARYRFFAKIYRETGASGIFLGHHADDQVETILYNLLRGAGGLKGMQERTFRHEEGQKMVLLRPLLNHRRQHLREYLAQRSQSFREDLSNRTKVAVRNRIRHEVLPLLDEIMTRQVAPIIQNAEKLCSEQRAYLEDQIQLKAFTDPQGRLFLPKLLNQHKAVQRLVLKKYLINHHVPQISYDLVDKGLEILEGDTSAKLNLPGGMFLRRREKRGFIDESGSGHNR